MTTQPQEGKTKITLSLVISYAFSLIAFLMSMMAVSEGSYTQAMAFASAAIISFAPFRARLAKDYNFTLSGGLVFVIAFCLFTYGTTMMTAKGKAARLANPTADSVVTEPVATIKVTALGLSNEYKQNEVAADSKYKGQAIEVTGTVETIGKDVLDTPYIALATQQYAIIDKVQCMFSKSDEAELATVKKGQKITLTGEVSGKMGNILVRHCAIKP